MFGLFKKRRKKLSMRRNSTYICTNDLNNVRNTLREGDEGDDVKNLQNMLMGIVHIYPKMPVITLNGIYDSQTRNAVRSFQNMMGISDTGIMDKNTYEKLKVIYDKKDQIKALERIEFSNNVSNNNLNTGSDLSYNVLKEGSKGRYVYRLQEYLRRVSLVNQNIPNIALDGIFGSETKKAVMSFQKEYGLEVTGIVDDEMWDKLYNEYMK